MIPNVQKTVEVAQIQFVDKIVDAPVVASHKPVPVDAETFSRVEDVSVGTQTVSRKTKLSMETESGTSADGMSDSEHGLVQGVESRSEMDETRERHAAGEDLDLLPVAPDMEAGGSHLQATAEEERIVDWTQDLREIRLRSISWCAGKGSLTRRRMWRSGGLRGWRRSSPSWKTKNAKPASQTLSRTGRKS